MTTASTKEFDVKKVYKSLYNLKAGEPDIVTVPSLLYFMIDGKGDPNTSEEFKLAIQALYGLSYTIKMMPKKDLITPGYVPYKVSPLEGLWRIKKGSVFSSDKKDNWEWTLMIQQPPFVTQELLKQAKELAKGKKNPSINLVRLESYEEGTCVQMLHIGPYSTEPETISQMEKLAFSQGYTREPSHHEIYLSAPGRTIPEKMKTILRFRLFRSS